MDSERFPSADGHVAEPGSPTASGYPAPEAGDPAPGNGRPAPETGDPRVDEAVAGLAALGGRPLEEHPQALEAAHDTLREILGELGEPGRPGRPGLQAQLGGREGPQNEGPRNDGPRNDGPRNDGVHSGGRR